MKMHASVIEIKAMVLSKSILHIDSSTCSTYIPYEAMFSVSKKRGSVFFLKLLIVPFTCCATFASKEEN
jgi:hypothetical protein